MPMFKEMTYFKIAHSPKTADLWILNSKYEYKEPESRDNGHPNEMKAYSVSMSCPLYVQ
jgi:hypothetical protein